MGTKRLGGENFERRPVLSGLAVADVMYEVNGVLLDLSLVRVQKFS